MQIIRQSTCAFLKALTAAILLLFATALTSYAQSTNIEFPTPVVSNEVSGVIEARDVGDPRLTRHFYLLGGTPGDLILSIESSNLNGDVDLFTAGSLRPLTKLNIFSGLSTTSTSKSVYLRRHESLILRIEARSASDEPGTYRVRFSGGFEPIANTGQVSDTADPTVSESRNSNRKVRRVNSAGARINEPLPEIALTTDPTEKVPPGTIEPDKTETDTDKEVAAPVLPAPVKPKPTKPPRVARTKPPARSTRKKSTTTAKKKEADPTPVTSPEPTPAEPVFNPRLIIETRDGVRIERYMSQVRRVTVERGLLIVITIDGKVERRPMSTVLRVAIEP